MAMAVSRRDFIRGGVAAFTVSFAAPAFLCDIARAQGARARNLVVVYLGGGNDALSTVVPYQDPFYYSRRPTIADAGRAGAADRDRLERQGARPAPAADRPARASSTRAGSRSIQRTGYPNSSRSHFQGYDIWGTADPGAHDRATGWLGRYLETVPADPLLGLEHDAGAAAGAAVARGQRAGDSRRAPPTRSPAPTPAPKRRNERAAATRDRVAPAGRAAAAGVRERQRAGGVRHARPRGVGRRATPARVAYPNNGFALALRTVAGAIVRGIGTRVFWVQTGGFDTHAGQGDGGGGGYAQPDGHLRRRRWRRSTTTCATRGC